MRTLRAGAEPKPRIRWSPMLRTDRVIDRDERAVTRRYHSGESPSRAV